MLFGKNCLETLFQKESQPSLLHVLSESHNGYCTLEILLWSLLTEYEMRLLGIELNKSLAPNH